MEIYFVRHGETGGNVGKRHQTPKTRLTKRGQLQAEEVGEQLAQLQPTHLVTSSFMRAVETASIVSQQVDLIPETSELFRELARPKRMHGQKHASATSVWYIIGWYFGWFGGEGTEIDGESRAVFTTRMQAAEAFLQTFPADARVVVVSHSVFINLFLDYITHGPRSSVWRALRLFWKIKRMKNASVTKLTLENQGGKWRWQQVDLQN